MSSNLKAMNQSSFSYKGTRLGAKTQSKWIDLFELIQSDPHPTYFYNLHSVQTRIDKLKACLGPLKHKIHYAVKANAHPHVLQLVKQNNCGVDTVSLGEMVHTLEHGFKPADIILSGVGKSKNELTQSLLLGIKQINVESLSELKRLGEIASIYQKSCRFGIRLNPDIKVDTHPYISTGFRENKFGIPEKQLSDVVEIVKQYSPWLNWHGLSVHIGSQIRDVEPLLQSAEALMRVRKNLNFYGIEIQSLDIGGGVGIDYKTDDESEELAMVQEYGQGLQRIFKEFPGEILLEPGRSLVARSGVLVTQVEYIKNNGFKNFIVVDSGMNHILRPSLYQAYHRILPLIDQPESQKGIFDVVGPICESSDVLGYERFMAEPREGDWLAVMDAGAYGFSMASDYNMHEKPNEICLL